MNISDPCEVCGTRGWLLVRSDEHGLRIERCDNCQTFTDEQAWGDAEPFLIDLLMRFDQGTDFSIFDSGPSSQQLPINQRR